MIKTRWGPVTEIVNTTFNMLVVIFTVALIANKFSHQSIALHVSLDYFLGIILIFGLLSILLYLITLGNMKKLNTKYKNVTSTHSEDSLL